MAIRIILNGTQTELPRTVTVKEFLEQSRMRPENIAVEVNREIVCHSEYNRVRLKENDHVEIVTMMGGG
ncbi:MAG: sulfur carrier protein ThiS [Candidatus Omnitrophica bacterium]|nr:sulfur carrier protein ThiS [Candidatus Omnitrophota bacterium]